MIRGQQFLRTRIELDNASYEDCTFTECEILYSAKGPVHAKALVFIDCTFSVAGAAARTVNLLADIYQFAPDVVEATFDSIRGVGNPPWGPAGGGWVTAG
ncbi:MAG TPA: hypothetical protein VGI19_14075 [Candidatus Cybelea sp.]|jgi:hypothetical protein